MDKKSIQPSSRSLSPSTLLSLTIPLILGFLIYQYTYSGPFLPLSCQLFQLNCPKASDTLVGFVDPEFSKVKNIFIKNIESGSEVGASVTIYYNDKIVVDLTGGIADLGTGRIYDKNTLQLVFSSTKVLSSLIVARFVERGILNYDEKISTYWPEFAQGNKENVTLSHLMTHSAGVGWFDTYLTKTSDLLDLDSFSKILEVQPHNFGGKPTRSYHACTRGYYLNEIIRRVDSKHRTIGQIVREEIMPTYDIEFYYSTPEDIYETRVAQIYSYPILRLLAKLILPEWMIINPIHQLFLKMFDFRTFTYKTLVTSCPDQAQPKDWNKKHMVKVEGPSYNGITNTHSMAKLAAMMANNAKPLPENQGIEPPLLNDNTLKKFLERDTTEFDISIFENITMSKGGIGFFRFDGIDYDFLGWGGAGGSLLLWNEELKIGFAYCMNAFHTALKGDERSLTMLKETVDTVLRLKNN
ncbi:beta-lactamase/transpeptidase-like protein [Glomus cerebriforme]|uniref:Beta-lactamase/transpeptidase-like protein n=1 Tax=Glomus cerebriforme TaxID=658196 RepID=A0A397T8M3_9GLOM|nr:beta-lactamase/transpeptidase-like protein [Glomus cerebriforme]